MSIGPATTKSLAEHGANLIIHGGVGPATIKQIVEIARGTGAHITISSNAVAPATAKQLAQLAGKNVTFIIE